MKSLKDTSRLLSLVLRHQPEKIGITLDDNGWVSVDDLLLKLTQYNHLLTKEDLISIVLENDKQRFSFSEHGTKIRANQGHSVSVDLQLKKEVPPQILYHGTSSDKVNSILKTGLNKGSRHHVHLSKDLSTATSVGSRHGKPVLFEVQSKQMYAEGFSFFISENGVWLTDEVPPKYLKQL